MKSKRFFSVFMIMLLFILALVPVSLYSLVKQNKVINEDTFVYQFADDLQMLLLQSAMDLDQDYQAFTYSETIDEDVHRTFSTMIDTAMKADSERMKKEVNLSYQIKNTKTEKTISERMDGYNENSKHVLYINMTFDESGNVSCNGSICDYQYQFDSFSFLKKKVGFNSTLNKPRAFIENGLFLFENEISYHNPKNLEVEFIIPYDLKPEGTIAEAMLDWQDYLPFTIFILMAGAIIVGIVLLAWPIGITSQAAVYSSLTKWKGEIVLAVLGISTGAVSILTTIFSSFYISGLLEALLEDIGISFYSQQFIQILNIIMWMIAFLIISLVFFWLKYVLSYGLWRYLKEKTLIAKLIGKINRIIVFDLKDPLIGKVSLFVFVQIVIIFLLLLVFPQKKEAIILFIYCLFMLGWGMRQIRKYQIDYRILLDYAKKLSKGIFDEEIQEDLGIFHSLKDELGNIRNGLEKALREETKSQNMKTELISNVSHDLKTPLTCIKNYVTLLEDEQLDDQKQKEYVSALRQYCDRLTRLIEDLFEVSKINSGNIQLNLVDLDLISLIEQAIAEFDDAFKEANLTLIPKYDSEQCLMNLDGDKTYRIFENLMNNIVKYSLPNSRVYIDVQDKQNEIVIQFKNISKQQMNFTPEEITERFVRGDKSRHENGSGLGLAIVKSLTEIQHGSFSIDIDGDLFKATVIFHK